jgi:hypothetical protein
MAGWARNGSLAEYTAVEGGQQLGLSVLRRFEVWW